jgi:uncharacterized glyoxalase superfamily protein PhnB
MVTNRSAPSSTVVPILVYKDVGHAIDWLCRAFGFAERLRFARDGVVSHAQLTVGDGSVMLGREGGPFRAPHGEEVTAYVHVGIDDVEEHFARATAAGASIVKPPTDMPFGVRQYTARDPAGHWWTFSQNIADVAPEDWGATTPKNR